MADGLRIGGGLILTKFQGGRLTPSLELKEESMAKKDEKYSVIARTDLQQQKKGFRRSGFEFSSTPLILDESQITKAILNEPMLIVTKTTPEVKEKKEK